MQHFIHKDEIHINNKKYYNLAYCLNKLNYNHFNNLFKDSKACSIHGDLTLENIIFNTQYNNNYFYIDVNPSYFETSSMDYAKLLQSCHKGYEFLLQNHYNTTSNDTSISFIDKNSQIYYKIYGIIKSYILQHFDEKEWEKALYQEIIYYLRLIPYKNKKDPTTALTYVAVCIILMNEYINNYIDN